MIKIFEYGQVTNEEIFARNNPTADVSSIVKEIIDNAKVTVSIVDNKVRRIISDKDLDKISNSLNVQTIAFNRRIKILQIIKDAENMDINEIEMLKEGIDELYYQKLKKK